MLLHIFDYLNPMDRQMLGMCCKKLYELSSLYAHEFKFHITPKYMASEEKEALVEFMTSLRDYRNVMISGVIFNDELLPYFNHNGPIIEHLCLCNAQFELPVFKFLELTPHLKSLEIYSCESVGKLDDETLRLLKLERLVLQYNEYLSKDEFLDLTFIAPNLSHFEFLHMQVYDDLEETMIRFLLRQCDKLRVVKILEYYLDDSSLSQMILKAAKFDLEKFYIKESQRLNILEFLRNQKRIVEIDLTEYNRIDQVIMKCICDEMPQLEHVKMYNSNLNDEIAGYLVSAMMNGKLPKLQTLDLSYCRTLTSRFALDNLTGQAYPSLRELKIDNLHIEDEAAVLITLTFPRLQVLSMAFAFQVTNVTLEAITTNLRHLQYLKLTNCPQLTEGIPNIAKLQALRILHLIEIPNVNDQQLEAFDFLNLKELHLVRCNFTDAGVDAITRSCPSLEVLDLSMNDKITEKAVVMIGDRLKRLTKLELRCCRRVGDEMEIQELVNSHFRSIKVSDHILKLDN